MIPTCAKVLGVPVSQLVGKGELILKAAEILNVSADELLGRETNAAKVNPGPQWQLQRKFEQVKLLPREKQKFILQFLDNMLGSNPQKQKA